ncbi:unnamed protein product [Closterium sp. NIES-65]|nr:unnamed protein product [Closterium sp. NIES-65]
MREWRRQWVSHLAVTTTLPSLSALTHSSSSWRGGWARREEGWMGGEGDGQWGRRGQQRQWAVSSPPLSPWCHSLPSHALCPPTLSALPRSLPSHALCPPTLSALPRSLPSHALCPPTLSALPRSLPSQALCPPRLSALPRSLPSHALCPPTLSALPRSLPSQALCPPTLSALPRSLPSRALCPPTLSALPRSLPSHALCPPTRSALPRALLLSHTLCPRTLAVLAHGVFCWGEKTSARAMDFDEFHLLPVEHASQAHRWLAVGSCNLVTASLVFFLIRHLPKGLPRLLALSPIILLNVVVPCVFSAAKRGECIEKGLVFWTVSWLGNFRLLALAWNRGSLTDPDYSSSFLQFLVALYMPMRNRVRDTAKTAVFSPETPNRKQSRRHKQPASESSPQLLLRGAFKAFLLSLTIRAYAFNLPAPAITLLHSANLFLFVTLLCELVAGVVAAVAPRFAVEPHFRRPYLATSLGSFWARRWNLVVSGSLRETVYEPVLDWLERPCSTEGEKAAEKRARGKEGNSEFGNGYPAASGGHDAVNGRGCGVSDGFEAVEKINGCSRKVNGYSEKMNGCSEKVNGYSERINGCYQRSSRKEEMGCVNGSGENQKGLTDNCGDTYWFHKAKATKQNGCAAPAAAAGTTGTSPNRHRRHVSFPRAAATIASFAVSGVMHELVILYIGGAMTGEQMVFFTLHGVLTVAEAWVRKEWGRRELVPIPKVVAGGLALGLLLSTGHVLFFEPYQRLGVIGCVVEGLQAHSSQLIP